MTKPWFRVLTTALITRAITKGFETISSTPKDIIRFKSLTFDVGQSNNGGFKVD